MIVKSRGVYRNIPTFTFTHGLLTHPEPSSPTSSIGGQWSIQVYNAYLTQNVLYALSFLCLEIQILMTVLHSQKALRSLFVRVRCVMGALRWHCLTVHVSQHTPTANWRRAPCHPVIFWLSLFKSLVISSRFPRKSCYIFFPWLQIWVFSFLFSCSFVLSFSRCL